MSFGKSNNQMSQDPRLTAAQAAQVEASNKFATGTLIPTYETAVKGATDIYNQGAGGVLNAAQNQAGVARQAQQTLGETGESALRTGVSGLQSLFNPDYEANQIKAALQPAQTEYARNIANQGATFGGAGQLGSARQALAERQTAGATQAQMAGTAAQVQRDIAAQRAGVGSTLANIGTGNIGQALGASGVATQAAMTPQDFYNKYASVIFGTPASATALGPTGVSQSSSGFNIGAKI